MDVDFELPDGRCVRFAGAPGETLLDVALDNRVPGIIGQCGGGCTCCTCHCWVDPAWLARLPPPGRDEQEMLVYAWGHNVRSRLICQIELTDALHGLRVRVPERQI